MVMLPSYLGYSFSGRDVNSADPGDEMRYYAKLLHAALTTTITLMPDAKAAETVVQSLLCDGTMTMTDARPEPINKMGFVVNLADHTVTFGGYVAKIDKVDGASIFFSGEQELSIGKMHAGAIVVMGHIDRATHAVSATTKTSAVAFTYDLHCKPVGRLF